MAENAGGTDSCEVDVLVDGKPGRLSLTSNGKITGAFSESSGRQFLPYTLVYDVLWAEVEGNDLELSYLKRGTKGRSVLARASWKVGESDKIAAGEWCKAVMEAAYVDVETRRRLRVLVNPHGGPGKARQIYTKTVEPIFQAARCEFETTFTERSKHATDIAKELSLERKYDALVLLSGDGLIHEVYNGFAEHDDPLAAFSIPIAPIPTGSANGTSVNLLGVKDGFDVGLASLNAIKGKPMRLDICSTTIGDERVFTYMSQAMGLMADVDLGTERLRWMGDLRFVLGFIYYGVFKLKTCPMTLAIKPVETDKDRMVEEFRARAEPHRQERLQRELDEHQLRTGKDSLPLLEHTEEPSEDDGWITFDKPILYLYAGKSPYVARDLMQFPVAHASDGLIDIVAQELTSRGDLFGAIDGAERGATFWKDTQHYFKARAYRVTPHTAHGNLSIDGERYPLQPFAVECHRALGALLSPTGRYAADFTVPRPAAERQKKQKKAGGGGGAGVGGEGQDGKKRGWKKWTGCC